jgi:hypothetical protein
MKKNVREGVLALEGWIGRDYGGEGGGRKNGREGGGRVGERGGRWERG